VRLRPALPSASLVALTAALALSGCSGSASGAATPVATSPDAPVIQPGRPGQPNTSLTGTAAAPRPAAPVDEDDVRFMQDMIVHHAQAVVMSALAQQNVTDTQVRAIASRIADEQKPEIDAMARWLEQRRQDVPPQAENPQFQAGPHAGHGQMKGMATPQQLEELAQARGVEADRMFLRLMTAHHEGALAMVLDHQPNGTDELVTQVADEIHVTQQTQINHMQRTLDRLA
jgi:uncharacterized protein (DUF305 family)